MKYAFLISCLLLLAGCKPFPAEAEKTSPEPTTSTVQASTSEEQTVVSETVENPTEPKPVVGEEIAPNNIVISVSNNSNNFQSVKRIEYSDASCFVVMNTYSWEGSISCIRK